MRETKFEISIPQNANDNQENIVIKNSIAGQYDELYKRQEIEITENNKEKVRQLILSTQDLIVNVMNDKNYNGSKDEKYLNLIYICHKLDLKLETYELKNQINDLSNASERLLKRQENLEQQSNNLVYNLLGFVTAFSVISASVAAITKINSIIEIALFMSFAILLLLTALIGLHNFYKDNNERKEKLQDNYFLWKFVLGIVLTLIIILGFMHFANNHNYANQFVDNNVNESQLE